MTTIQTILYSLITDFENAVFYVYLSNMLLVPKKNSKRNILIWFTTYFALMIGCILYYGEYNPSLAFGFIVSTSFIFYSDHFKYRFFALISALSIQCLVDISIIALASVIISKSYYSTFIQNELLLTFIGNTELLVLVLFLMFLKKTKIIPKIIDFKKIPKIQIIGISMLLVLIDIYIIFININLDYSNQVSFKLSTNFLLFTLLMSFAMILIIIFLVYKNIINNQLEQQNSLTKQQLEYQLNHYEQLERSIKETRQIKHDMHHHLTCLKELIAANQYTQSELYIENIEKSLSSVKKHLETGNIIVDAIIHEKLHKIDELQITFKFEGSLPPHDFISLMDLCTIIANSFDNAIEACANHSEEHHRFILIETSVENHCWKYKIKNSSKEIEVCSFLLSTSKTDKVNHGFGLLNVKEAVARYNGDFEYRYDEGDFILETKILLI